MSILRELVTTVHLIGVQPPGSITMVNPRNPWPLLDHPGGCESRSRDSPGRHGAMRWSKMVDDDWNMMESLYQWLMIWESLMLRNHGQMLVTTIDVSHGKMMVDDRGWWFSPSRHRFLDLHLTIKKHWTSKVAGTGAVRLNGAVFWGEAMLTLP